MPYALRGNTVIREDTGAVVKVHPTRAKALAHLRALKINVEAQEVFDHWLDEHAEEWLPTELEESEKTAAYAVTPHPLGPGPLWHHKGMMLPPYIQNVAAGIMKSGRPRSMAIAAAIGVIKRWATGRGGVKPEVRAAAAAALAQWEALRATARAATGAKKVGKAVGGAAGSSGSSKSS
jgi:hypothetical protein